MATSNPNNIKSVKKLALPGDVLSIAVVAGTSQLFAGGSDGKIYHVDLAEDKPAPTSWDAHVSYISGLVLTESHLVSAGSDHRMIWWDRRLRRQVRSLEAHGKWIRHLALSPDGKTIASVGDDMVCRLWEAETGKLAGELRGHEAQVHRAPTDEDRSRLKQFGWTSPEMVTPHYFPSKLYTCAFSSDGTRLATADKVGHIVVWDVASGKSIRTLDAPLFHQWETRGNYHSFGGIRALAFSPDGKHLAAGGIENKDAAIVAGIGLVQVFDWEKGERTHEFKAGGNCIIEGLRFHHKGDWLLGTAGAGAGGKLLFYDLPQKKVLNEVVAPMIVFALTMNATSDEIYTAGRGQVVQWSLKG